MQKIKEHKNDEVKKGVLSMRSNKWKLIVVLIIILSMSGAIAVYFGNRGVNNIASVEEENKEAYTVSADGNWEYTEWISSGEVTLRNYIGTATNVTLPTTIDGKTINEVVKELLN